MSLSKEVSQSFPESTFKTPEDLNVLISRHEMPSNHDESSVVPSTYHKLSCLCVLANITVLGCMIVGPEGASPEYLRRSSTIALSANFCACIVIRNEHVINAITAAACSLPHCTPLSMREAAAQIYCHGGIHSGCAMSGAIWYLVFTCICFLGPQRASGIRLVLSFVSGIAMLHLSAILVFSHPLLRARYHNVFELTHRLLGWAFVCMLWLQVVLAVLAESAENTGMVGQQLLMDVPFWLLIVSTALLVYPWTQLRSIPVEAQRLSDDVLRLTIHHTEEESCMTRRLATVPLKETHAFATVPGKDGKTYSVYISAAGDWTRRLVSNPPSKIWVKGSPVYGATRSSRLFRKVLFVATGSGIAPVLSAVFSRLENEIVIFWITTQPSKKLDLEQLQKLEAYRNNIVIFNAGRDAIEPRKVSAIVYGLHCEHQSDAVFVVSNRRLTEIVKADLARCHVPVFGPIFDS
jgi:predicted ferric reductase